MEDAANPMLIQVVAKLAFRYGKTADEWKNSFVFVRINAFAAKARIGKSFETLSLWAPVRGVVELTDSEYGSSQLVGCVNSSFFLLPAPPPLPLY